MKLFLHKLVQGIKTKSSLALKHKWWILIFVLMVLVIGFSVRRIIIDWPSDFSGWGQLIIETFTLPIIAFELYRISKELGKSAEIDIGVVGIKEYPLSNIRSIEKLPIHTKISQGYPLFCLVIRNKGQVSARFVKIHLEFVGHEPTFKSGELSTVESMASPVIKIYESDTQNIFNRENNVDFVFRGGTDWVLRPYDSEKFDFFISSFIGTKDSNMPYERPYPSICQFTCTIWADGLENPIIQRVEVEIERNAKEENG
jgi:hypothetical protein